MSEFNIPEKCLKCPMIIRPTEQIETLDEFMDRSIQALMSDTPDDVAEEAYAMLQATNADDLPETITPEALAESFRHELSNKVELVKEFRNSLAAKIGERTLNCFGPATIEGYVYPRHYEVTLCQSPVVTDQATETAVVKRSR